VYACYFGTGEDGGTTQGRCPLMCCWMMVDVILISFEQVSTEYNYQQQLKKLERKWLMREYGERHEV